MAVRTHAYECNYCGALKRTKVICERHELTCFNNPEAKNCLLCIHITKTSGDRACGVTGKRCSVAISATCEHFVRRENND